MNTTTRPSITNLLLSALFLRSIVFHTESSQQSRSGTERVELSTLPLNTLHWVVVDAHLAHKCAGQMWPRTQDCSSDNEVAEKWYRNWGCKINMEQKSASFVYYPNWRQTQNHASSWRASVWISISLSSASFFTSLWWGGRNQRSRKPERLREIRARKGLRMNWDRHLAVLGHQTESTDIRRSTVWIKPLYQENVTPAAQQSILFLKRQTHSEGIWR